MMKTTLILAAFILSALSASVAQAQFVVSDPGTEASTAATAVGVDALNVGVDTMNGGIETLNGSTRELIGHVSTPRVVQDTSAPPVPILPERLDVQLFDSDVATPSAASGIYGKTVAKLAGTDAEAGRLREKLAESTNAIGVANGGLSTIDARLAAGQAELAKLSSATDLMQATVEVGAMLKRNKDAALLAAQAANLQVLVTTQQQLNEVKEAADQREERAKTMTIFAVGGAVP